MIHSMKTRRYDSVEFSNDDKEIIAYYYSTIEILNAETGTISKTLDDSMHTITDISLSNYINNNIDQKIRNVVEN